MKKQHKTTLKQRRVNRLESLQVGYYGGIKHHKLKILFRHKRRIFRAERKKK